MNNKAFTLIELLVVIAIIGILSGLIVVSMTGATNSAKDARIKAGMDQLRSAAEVYKSVNDKYSASVIANNALTCPGTDASFMDSSPQSDGDKVCQDIQTQSSATNILIYANNSTGSSAAWCAMKALLSGGNWCVDYTGRAGTTGTCDANYLCD